MCKEFNECSCQHTSRLCMNAEVAPPLPLRTTASLLLAASTAVAARSLPPSSDGARTLASGNCWLLSSVTLTSESEPSA